MAKDEKKVPVKPEQSWAPLSFFEHPFEQLRRQVDRLFTEFPFARGAHEPQFPIAFTSGPAVDVVEKDTEYCITAELPGLDEKNVEVKLSN